MIFAYGGLVLLALIAIAIYLLAGAVERTVGYLDVTVARVREEFSAELESVAASLRLLVSQGKPSSRRYGEERSLVRWYFMTPERVAGRIGADMGEHLLVLWLTDEHGQRLQIVRETFGQRGGLVQYPVARTGDWRFFPTLPALELAMGWKQPLVGLVAGTLTDDGE
jgi:hypothetical protein